jgi:hypothetical protein
MLRGMTAHGKPRVKQLSRPPTGTVRTPDGVDISADMHEHFVVLLETIGDGLWRALDLQSKREVEAHYRAWTR